MRQVYRITKRSQATGVCNTLEVEMDINDYNRWLNGGYIQDCLGYLAPALREFLITGITPEEWRQIFGEE